jgi:nucleoside-diphosphate-sugar epimerase
MNKVLLTGATGFVGRALVDSLIDAKSDVTALVREPSLLFSKEVKQVIAGDLNEWPVENSLFIEVIKQALEDINIVIHLAARVHVMADNSNDPLAEFRAVNCDATLVLAKIAADAGVKRFIFISSVKVNGEMTELNKPFKPEDQYVPTDPYGLSKYEAEQGLLALAKVTGMEVVIIRPPLVYGPGVSANFASMMKWINKKIPLPFGAIHNLRSLVALDNLVSFIVHCLAHPKAANQIFIISDGEDVSTTTLLRKVAKAFGKSTCLLPVPVSLMNIAAKLIGKNNMANRLFGSLQVDSSKARDLLAWRPVTTMSEQLKKTADDYLVNEKTF